MPVKEEANLGPFFSSLYSIAFPFEYYLCSLSCKTRYQRQMPHLFKNAGGFVYMFLITTENTVCVKSYAAR